MAANTWGYITDMVLPEIPAYRMFEDVAEKYPNKVAIYYKDQTYTYSELDRCANCFAAGLTKLGVKQHDRVCLFLPNSPEYVIGFFGGMKAGAIVSQANPTYTAREIEYQCRESNSVVILTRAEFYPTVKKAAQNLSIKIIVVPKSGASVNDSEVIHFKEFLADNTPTPSRPAVDARNHLALLPFTSGTTGLPKGVMLSHYNLTSNWIQYILEARQSCRDVYVLFLPMYHIYATCIFGTALVSGGTLVIQERWHIQETLDLIHEYRPTVLALVPPVVVRWVNHPGTTKIDWSSVRECVSAAAILSRDLVRKFYHMTGVKIMEAYGLTECAPFVHKHAPGIDLQFAGTVGTPLIFTEQKVVDKEGKELPPGQDGELCVKGPQVMLGYWRHPKATAKVVKDGWFHTGDVAYIDNNGHAVITDREKDMIKVKGFAVGPAELEGILLTHEAVADCAVIGVPHELDGETPKAFVVKKQEVTAKQLMDYVKERAAKYKHVTLVEFIDAIPKNPSGKILKRVLKKRAMNNSQPQSRL